jgi:hypothetical protein
MASISNRPLDGRTKLAKRAKQLERAFAAELGSELSQATAAAVRRVAELFAICEQARARWMAGDPTMPASEVATLDNALKRAAEYLGIAPKELATKAAQSEDFQSEMLRLATPPAEDDEA